MTPEEINGAIMESIGWKRRADLDFEDGPYGWQNIWERDGRLYTPANYYEDLSLIHEAIHSLDNSEMSKLLHILSNKVLPQKSTGRLQDILPMCAKAPQLCESYLRMKGLWKE